MAEKEFTPEGHTSVDERIVRFMAGTADKLAALSDVEL